MHKFIHILSFVALYTTNMVMIKASNQCNLGHKLYSIESGNSICASLAPFQCAHACQWNTSCANTAHSIAFQGRRSFVSGFILTDNNFLILCCATLAQQVQQNQRNENRCIWVPPTMTVENNPSIRFDPPLNSNEYVRDMSIKRLAGGRVEVKSQICKFVTQRTNCDEKTMPEEDKQVYSLLQLRLSRTESFFKNHNGTDPRDFFDLPIPKLTNRGEFQEAGDLSRGTKVASKSTEFQQISTAIHPVKNLVQPEFFFHEQTDSADSKSHPLRPSQQPSSSVPFAQQLPNRPFTGKYLPAQPIHAFVTEGNAFGKSLSNSNVLSQRAFWPQFQSRLRPLNSQTSLSLQNAVNGRSGRLNGVAQLHTSNIHSSELDDHRAMSFESSPDTFFSLSGGSTPSPNKPSQRFALSTNQSYEIAHKYRRASLANRFHHRHNLYKSPSGVYNFGDSLQIEERPFKSALAIRKLHLGTTKIKSDISDDSNEPISYGGSFESGELATSTRNLRTFNNLRPFLSQKFPDEGDEVAGGGSMQLPQGFVQQLKPTAPAVIFQPTQRTISDVADRNDLFGNHPGAHTVYQSGKQFQVQHAIPILSSISSTIKPAIAPPHMYKDEAKKQELLGKLLDCCQQQAPGCRHLCTPNVSKDQIKHAIQTNECPPLSMTSVLQCFPRFYNVKPVEQCCEQAVKAQSTTNPPATSSINSLPDSFTTSSPRLPAQCQSLCEPDFKLSFSHFACVDHISTIVDCYRDLLVK